MGSRRGSALLVAFCVVACSTKQPPPPSVDAAVAPSVDAAPSPADASIAEAGVDASTDAAIATVPVSVDPFGVAKTATRAGCSALGNNVAKADILTSFVDGDDLLALVNRSPTGTLPPDYAPSDLVDIQSKKAQSPSNCETVQCLRKDAATALDTILAGMKTAGFPGKVESAFRSYGNQCGTFGNWARKGSFCDATEQSALPGHSQHQLGTTVDLFTEEWAKDERGVFRDGFGCTDAGRWIREHATEYGFVMPYPIHPDDRHPKQKCTARWDIPVEINPKTGYRYEHWHIRYVGIDAAKRFKAAFDASPIGKPDELTVEQWLRKEKGISGDGDTELPVCDGCNCGACGTLAAPGEGTCEKKGGAVHLDEHGKPRLVEGEPSIVDVAKGRKKSETRIVEVKLDVPAGLLTQPPMAGPSSASYVAGATFAKLAPFPDTQDRGFAPLGDAWVVAVEPIPNDTGVAWPWRAALTTSPSAILFNRADLVLPAHVGATTIRVPIPSGVSKAKVVLLKGGQPHGQERAAPLD